MSYRFLKDINYTLTTNGGIDTFIIPIDVETSKGKIIVIEFFIDKDSKSIYEDFNPEELLSEINMEEVCRQFKSNNPHYGEVISFTISEPGSWKKYYRNVTETLKAEILVDYEDEHGEEYQDFVLFEKSLDHNGTEGGIPVEENFYNFVGNEEYVDTLIDDSLEELAEDKFGPGIKIKSVRITNVTIDVT
jgi:hypothetical protein